ncbi:MAG: AAA family ATPase [Alphaproteobacteria bacterium]|jgi:chromosome partitioning protein|nr:AAA family ATPase [Alphaproteobacteria bacterium]MCB1550573.1 AAA family ATPase [Alphaproteobacteria bacterium]MCB9984219.1 AAA family ATPase [Micavibrio sp.]HPQ51330.1 ParA family partition ATPase [Alphaproteobacteria bacterium]HRK97063.1 ParA family partition ATPase [Alphaproteobacteria bacterium]
MTGKVFTVAQHKGGAGKTTLSAQLAAALDQTGGKVLIIDVDPQGSLTEWHKMRSQTLGRKNKITLFQTQGWKMMRELPRIQREFDYIIIDTPPHAESESSIAIRLADLVLMPMQPSPLDVWACAPTIKIIVQEKKPLMLVMNRVPAKSRLNETIKDKLDGMNIQVARATLGNRVAFASSIMQGLGVGEFDARGMASLEMAALLKEIKKHKAFKDISKAA